VSLADLIALLARDLTATAALLPPGYIVGSTRLVLRGVAVASDTGVRFAPVPAAATVETMALATITLEFATVPTLVARS
jgi:hypothetical protein